MPDSFELATEILQNSITIQEETQGFIYLAFSKPERFNTEDGFMAFKHCAF